MLGGFEKILDTTLLKQCIDCGEFDFGYFSSQNNGRDLPKTIGKSLLNFATVFSLNKYKP